MYHRKPRDQEEQLLAEQALLLRHKQELELQQAQFGPAYRPSHLPIQIAELEREIKSIKRRIAYARRNKRLKATMQQVATASKVLTSPSSPRRRRARHTGSYHSSIPSILIGTLLLIGFITGIGRLQPGQADEYLQTDAAPLTSIMLPAPEAVVIPTMAPIQETAMAQDAWSLPDAELTLEGVVIPTISPLQETALALGDWPPSDAERRVIGATGGIGVKLRVDPYEEAYSFTSLSDGTLVYLIEKSVDEVGTVWWWVALSYGNTGYIKEQYLLAP